MKKNIVSIIITTKNSDNTIEPLLKSIKNLKYKNYEIIVVDNNSTDKTKKIAQKYTKKIFNKGPERSAQRNFGAKKSIGDYLLVLDSDMTLTSKVLQECINKFINKSRNIILGALIIPEKSFGEGFWAKTKIFEREINEGQSYFEAARFFPKKIFNEFHGYDLKLTGPEDWDLPQRISKKYKIGRIKAKILHNEGKPTLLGLTKRKYYYGLSLNKYLKKQRISLINPYTVYFLRTGFYKNWKKIIKKPIISIGISIMLLAESIGGFIGYIIGRVKNG